MELFSALNPYQKLAAIIGDSPEDLIEQLSTLPVECHLMFIVPWMDKQVAYISGDFRERPKKTKTS